MSSYEKFNYLVRPAKQIERKLLIEGLHQLSACGFPIRKYRYVGFGSPFYADFLLFHKYLYIEDMLCVEGSDIKRRMKFNKPFPKVALHMGKASGVIPKLDRDQRHVVWVDYDYRLTPDMLSDLSGFAATLRPESVLIVTVDADPRVFDDLPEDIVNQIRDFRRQKLDDEIGRWVDGGVKRSHLTRPALPTLYASVIRGRLHDALKVRKLEFLQLFNFSYADGRQMLSIGGMIGSADEKKRLRSSDIYQLKFVNETEKPIVISAPPLTQRERLWLDQNLESPLKQFEMKSDDVAHYRRYYRYYPSYFEALL